MSGHLRFASAFSKIERAKHHIAQLESEFEKYVRTDFACPLVYDNLMGRRKLIAHTKIPLPETIPLALGDAIHNLSAALDHVMHQLVPMKTFPTHEDRESLIRSFADADPNTGKKAGGNNPIKLAFPDLVDLIVDQIRPYDAADGSNADGRAVWALRKLDNIDKHRMIIPVLNISEIGGIDGSDGYANTIMMGLTVRFVGGTALDIGEVSPNFQIHGYRQATADIRFPEGTYFTGKPIIPALLQLHECALGVVKTFEAHFKGR